MAKCIIFRSTTFSIATFSGQQHNCVLRRHFQLGAQYSKRKYFRENVVIETERLQSLFVMKINWLQRQYPTYFGWAVTLGWRERNERMHLGKGNSCDLIHRMWNVNGFIAWVDRYIDFYSLICVLMWWMLDGHCLEFHIDDKQCQRKRKYFDKKPKTTTTEANKQSREFFI